MRSTDPAFGMGAAPMEARVDRRASVTAMLPVTLMSWAAAMKRMNRGYVTALPSMFTVAPREHTNFASSALTPLFLMVQWMVTGSVAAEDDVLRAVTIAGAEFR